MPQVSGVKARGRDFCMSSTSHLDLAPQYDYQAGYHLDMAIMGDRTVSTEGTGHVPFRGHAIVTQEFQAY